MEITGRSSRRFESIAWGALLIWWGITAMVTFLPAGVGAIGFGLILLSLNAARYSNSIPVDGFTATLGVLACLAGSLQLAGVLLALPFELPVFAILLIALGVIVLVRDLASNSGR